MYELVWNILCEHIKNHTHALLDLHFWIVYLNICFVTNTMTTCATMGYIVYRNNYNKIGWETREDWEISDDDSELAFFGWTYFYQENTKFWTSLIQNAWIKQTRWFSKIQPNWKFIFYIIPPKCIYCNKTHYWNQCSKFLSSLSFEKSNKICLNCLRYNQNELQSMSWVEFVAT